MLWLLCACVFFRPVLASSGYNAISDTVNKTIINIVSKLGDISFPNFTVSTNGQEFGKFNLDLIDIDILGIDTLRADIIDLKIIPIELKNLTVFFEHVEIKSKNYSLAGTLQFPFGDKLIPLTGTNGEFSTTLHDLRVSVSVKFSLFPPVHIEDLVLEANATGMTLHMGNLMGGGDLGWAFNTVLNDVAIVAFDYYKDVLILALHEPLKEVVGQILCQILTAFCTD